MISKPDHTSGIGVTFVIQHLKTGGAEKQLLLGAGHLAQLGIPVRVLTLSNANPSPRLSILLQWAQNCGVALNQLEGVKSRGMLGVLCSAIQLAKLRSGIWWTWGLRADLLGKVMSLIAPDIRLVSAQRNANRDRILKDARLIRFRHRRVSLYVANSTSNCRMLEEVIPGVTDRCRVVYNCLTSEELAAPCFRLPPVTGKVRVVMVGNIKIRHKGYDLACEAAAQWRVMGLPIELHVVGRPDELSKLNALRAAFDVEDIVHYHGESSDPSAFLRTGHAFMLSSRVEGMPNALMEAMNLGMPCISTRVGDVGLFAETGRHLELCEVGDARALADAVARVATDWPRAVRMGEAARGLCRELFTPERMAQENFKILSEVVA